MTKGLKYDRVTFITKNKFFKTCLYQESLQVYGMAGTCIKMSCQQPEDNSNIYKLDYLFSEKYQLAGKNTQKL